MQRRFERQAFQRYTGHTTMVTVGAERLRLTAGQRPDGTLGAVTIGWGKHGSSDAGLLESYATAISVGLQHGAPLADLLRPGLGLRFAPNGRTDDPDIPEADSLVDYCCRRLAIDWLPLAERARLGVLASSEDGLWIFFAEHGGDLHPVAELPGSRAGRRHVRTFLERDFTAGRLLSAASA